MIQVGEKAPDFTLPGIQDGEKRDYTLSEYHGRKVVRLGAEGDEQLRVVVQERFIGCTRPRFPIESVSGPDSEPSRRRHELPRSCACPRLLHKGGAG